MRQRRGGAGDRDPVRLGTYDCRSSHPSLPSSRKHFGKCSIPSSVRVLLKVLAHSPFKVVWNRDFLLGRRGGERLGNHLPDLFAPCKQAIRLLKLILVRHHLRDAVLLELALDEGD